MEILIPKQIDIEVTSRCNLSCRYCPMLTASSAQDMSWETFESIISRIVSEPRLKDVTVVPWLNGEPLLHPRYSDMVRLLISNRIRFYITTNGMIWKQDVYDAIMSPESTCYQLIFSLDGMPTDASSSIELARPGTRREKVLETIRTALDMKAKLGSSIDICTKICMRGQDWGEIEAYVNYWLVAGVDFVCVGRNLTDENTPGMRVFPCQYSDNSFMVIKSDGALTLCAYNSEMTNNRAYAVGNVLNETPLLELYNNEAYTTFRTRQRKGIFEGPCATCGFAYTGHGFRGEIKFRNPLFPDRPIYFHQDYYNSFFSYKKRWKDDTYYAPGFSGSISSSEGGTY